MKDYMQTPEELKKQPDAYRTFEEIANGDVAVYNFLVAYWNFAHVFDDLLDKSDLKDEQKERAMKALHDFTVDLMLNPFVQRHATELRGLMVSSMCRCLDGDKLKKDPKQKALAPAVSCGDVDLIVHVAYLHRGWDLMRKIGGERTYDIH